MNHTIENEIMMSEAREYFNKFPDELIYQINSHIIGSTCYISRIQVEEYFNDDTIPAQVDSNPLAFHSPVSSKSKPKIIDSLNGLHDRIKQLEKSVSGLQEDAALWKFNYESVLSEKEKGEAIILALCRCALFNATDATRHQIYRLIDLYRSSNNNETADKIDSILNPEPNEMDNLKIVQSLSNDVPVGVESDYHANMMYRASNMFRASGHNEVYATSDGELWHYKHSVEKTIKGLDDKTVITITRAEVEKYFSKQ